MVQDKPIVFAVCQDKGTLHFLEDACSGAGMAFLTAGSPASAVEDAKPAGPDVVILDESIRGGEWLEIYRGFQRECPATFLPILVLVDAGRAEEAIEKMESGLVDVLAKPVNESVLKARLRAMLRIKQIHDDLASRRAAAERELQDERHLREELAAANEELKKLSTTDGLTGLANHRSLLEWLKTEFEVASRYQLPLSAIMIDLDEFKKVNDEHGHLFGDFVLQGVARIIRAQSRRADFCARYGGEEFMVILPNTDGYAASNLAQRIHQAIARRRFPLAAANFPEKDNALDTEVPRASQKSVASPEDYVRITASLGISTYPVDGVNSAKDLIDLADRALYTAKSRGRDRVISWSQVR